MSWYEPERLPQYWPPLLMELKIGGTKRHAEPTDINYPPSKVYKYVDEVDAHFLEMGSLKIGSLQSYGHLEDERADGGEGTATSTLNRRLRINPGDETAALLAATGALQILGPVDINFGNSRFTRKVEDLYCLCFSLSPNVPDRGKPQAVFEVRDLRRVVERLTAIHAPLGAWFPGVVSYGSRETDLIESGLEAPNPFLKPSDFAWEREARVIWKPAVTGEIATLAEPDAEIARLVRRIR